jgi:hypothetical protein
MRALADRSTRRIQAAWSHLRGRGSRKRPHGADTRLQVGFVAASAAVSAVAVLALASARPGLAVQGPVLGTTAVNSATDQDAAGLGEAFQARAWATAQVSAIVVYVDSSSQASQLHAGIYADSSGRPGSLLAQGSLDSPSRGAWNTVLLSAPAQIVSGSTYWLAVLGTGGTLVFHDCRGCGSTSVGSAQANLSSLPSSWSSGSVYRDAPLSAYATGSQPDSASSSTTTTAPLTTTVTSTPTTTTGSATTTGAISTPTGTTSTSAGTPTGATTTTAATTTAATTTSAPDTVAPSAPGGLKITSVGQTGLTLAWSASTDNVSVSGYNVFQGSARIGSTTATGYSFSGLACGTTYVFGVQAFDAAGNLSAVSSISTATAPCSTVYVSLSGSDANACTQTAPCRSFDRAYHVAKPGQVVQVAGGDYGHQSLSYDSTKVGASSNVVFEPAPGASVTVSDELDSRPSPGQGVAHVEFDNMQIGDVYLRYSQHVVLRNISMGFFFLRSTVDVQILGGENYGDTYGTPSTVGAASSGDPPAQNTVIDWVSFHDFNTSTAPGAHDECLFVQESVGTVVRHSIFTRCEDFDIYLNPILGGSVRGAVLDHNQFGQTAPKGYYAVRSNVAQYSVTANVFDQGISWDAGSSVTGCGNTTGATGFSLPSFLTAPC